jgi:uncharacterized protein (TIGR03382 family)
MRLVATVIGWVFLVIATAFVFLGIASWPPGGLMFALPFVFLIPGIMLAVLGAVLVWLGRRRVPVEARGSE